MSNTPKPLAKSALIALGLTAAPKYLDQVWQH